jgi:hypothetical protein
MRNHALYDENCGPKRCGAESLARSGRRQPVHLVSVYPEGVKTLQHLHILCSGLIACHRRSSLVFVAVSPRAINKDAINKRMDALCNCSVVLSLCCLDVFTLVPRNAGHGVYDSMPAVLGT